MTRRMLFVLAAATLAALAVPAVPAVAGGGHGCDAGATTGVGDVVEIANGCFDPTALQIEPGAAVTFVNLDPFQHNVSASGWGHLDPLNEGDSFRVTFDDEGVYPFACQYHPGMVGAIVVGDGTGAGTGEVVTGTSEQPASLNTVQRAASNDAGSATGWFAGGAIGLAAGLGIGVLVRRRVGENRGT